MERESRRGRKWAGRKARRNERQNNENKVSILVVTFRKTHLLQKSYSLLVLLGEVVNNESWHSAVTGT